MTPVEIHVPITDELIDLAKLLLTIRGQKADARSARSLLRQMAVAGIRRLLHEQIKLGRRAPPRPGT